MAFNQSRFKAELMKSTRDTLAVAKASLTDSEMIGFALYSDDDASVISVTINDRDRLHKKSSESPEYTAYYRWSPGEWAYEMVNISAFDPVNQILSNASQAIRRADYPAHKAKVYNLAVEVLEELKAEGLFSDLSPDFVLMFAISDFADKDLEIGWVERLNRKTLAEEFATWLESEED